MISATKEMYNLNYFSNVFSNVKVSRREERGVEGQGREEGQLDKYPGSTLDKYPDTTTFP